MTEKTAQDQMELDHYDPEKKRPNNVYPVQRAVHDMPFPNRPEGSGPAYKGRELFKRKTRKGILPERF
jgi:hypothetical protein